MGIDIVVGRPPLDSTLRDVETAFFRTPEFHVDS